MNRQTFLREYSLATIIGLVLIAMYIYGNQHGYRWLNCATTQKFAPGTFQSFHHK